MNFELRCVVVALGVMLGATGCARKEQKPEITDLQRKEAAFLMTEVEFALTLRDYTRAETALNRVVALTPDDGSYWVTLGSVRKRLGNANGARDAYRTALQAYETEAKASVDDPDPWLKQAYVLALLGRVDDGRAVVEKAKKQFPANRTMRIFVDEKRFDQMLADPGFKEAAL